MKFSRSFNPVVLSVAQPWAWAIIHGPKRIENRTWRTNYRGRLLIHASRSTRFLGDAWPEGVEPRPPAASQLVYGAIIGFVEMVDCVSVRDVSDDPFASGPWCWVLSSPRAFDRPIVCKGQMGLFPPPVEAVRAMEADGESLGQSRIFET